MSPFLCSVTLSADHGPWKCLEVDSPILYTPNTSIWAAVRRAMSKVSCFRHIALKGLHLGKWVLSVGAWHKAEGQEDKAQIQETAKKRKSPLPGPRSSPPLPPPMANSQAWSSGGRGLGTLSPGPLPSRIWDITPERGLFGELPRFTQGSYKIK